MSEDQPTVAYIMSRFPKLTETFVLYEMLELRRLGFRVLALPLRIERENVHHPEIRDMEEDTLPAPLTAPRTWWLNLKWFLCHPIRYLTTLARVAIMNVGSRKLFFGALLYFPKAVCFAHTAKRIGVCHIHAHFATHPAMTAWCVKQLAGIPYSFTAHGSDLHVDQQMLATKARDAAFAVTVSEYNRNFIQTHCGSDSAAQFLVIHTGTDLNRFHPPSECPPKQPNLRILCIAAFRPVKGHDVLMRACAKLHGRGVAFHCTLVGYGTGETALKETIQQLDLTEHVTIAGPQPRPVVIELLGQSDVIALASIQTARGNREGIPVALMEGMACGLPAVASRISGIPELITHDHDGLLFTPGDAEDAANALCTLAENPEERRRLGSNARKTVEQAFDISQNAAQLAHAIQSHIP
jgi:colanic acid/amylovoran biosynthesis glycosyltransferase